MRSIGLDIHRDFAEVAIAEGGEVRSAPRIEMTPQALELFAESLGRDDRVALEVSGNAWEVARIIRPHVAKPVCVSPADTGIRAARAKTDRLDARTLRGFSPPANSTGSGSRTRAASFRVPWGSPWPVQSRTQGRHRKLGRTRSAGRRTRIPAA